MLESLDVLLLRNRTRALSCTRNAQEVAVLDLSCVVLFFFCVAEDECKEKGRCDTPYPSAFS